MPLRRTEACRLVPFPLRVDCTPHRLGVIARIEVFAGDVVVRHLVRLHEIREPHFVRLLAGLARHRVERNFECEAHAR